MQTTTINCLTGALPPTYGDALVYGQSIRSTGGMNKIRSQMGVCPQFDVLWPELSGREHLLLYGRIKGVHGWKAAAQEADDLLDKVGCVFCVWSAWAWKRPVWMMFDACLLQGGGLGLRWAAAVAPCECTLSILFQCGVFMQSSISRDM